MVVNRKEQLRSSTRMNNGDLSARLRSSGCKCDLADQSVSRDKFAFSLGVPFEL